MLEKVLSAGADDVSIRKERAFYVFSNKEYPDTRLKLSVRYEHTRDRRVIRIFYPSGEVKESPFEIRLNTTFLGLPEEILANYS